MAQGHRTDAIVNAIDGIAGRSMSANRYGAPEIVTGGSDGGVCVWDCRQKDFPVARFDVNQPGRASVSCWSVCFGNSFDDDERCVFGGFEDGTVAMYDLRMMVDECECGGEEEGDKVREKAETTWRSDLFRDG